MAVLLGGLIATSAMAQTQMASAVPAPQRDVVVFADKGASCRRPPRRPCGSPSEGEGARQVTLVGRSENVAPVKAELERGGVPASAIVVEHGASASSPRPSDGLSEPADRRVEIRL